MKFNPLVPELLVSDIEKTIGFYVGILGFHINYSRQEDGFYFVERQGAQLMLEPYEEGTPYSNGKPTKPFGRGMNFEIGTSDIDVLYGTIESNNYPIHFPIEEKWYRIGDVMGGTKQFMVTDPDGYLLRFSQDLGIKPIEVEG